MSSSTDRYLFVIAHAKRSGPVRHSVHKFAISPDAPGELRYVETFESSEHLISPNDVMPVGERAFFVTNDHTGRSEAAMLLQDLQVLPTNLFPTNVVYFDGGRWQVAVDGLFTANGINTSPDRSLLYVADAGRGTVLTYNLTAIHQLQGEHHDLLLLLQRSLISRRRCRR
jgi:sugar lactone lactonase YvrE